MSTVNVLVLDDDEKARESICQYLDAKGYSARGTGFAQLCCEVQVTGHPDVILMDCGLADEDRLRLVKEMSGVDARAAFFLMTGRNALERAEGVMKDGVDGFLSKPVDLVLLSKLIEKSLEARRRWKKDFLPAQIPERGRMDPFVGVSSSIGRLRELAERVVGSEHPILIQGETGSGKGVLANWFHKNSPRRKESFVELNCAGLNRELLESELFGHEKGAFTGAIASTSGLFEIAHRGTLFLDEVGDMDLSIQPKLLKVLDEQRFRRIGELRERVVDVRLIAATHQDLAGLVADRKFRADLFFRLNIIPIRIPALRERIHDIPVLAKRILESSSRERGQGQVILEDGVPEVLMQYRWPGNIRELRNVLVRAALMCDGDVIRTEDIKFQPIDKNVDPTGSFLEYDLTLDELVQLHITQVLMRVDGNVEKAASKLGIPRSTLYAKVKQYSLRHHPSPINERNRAAGIG